MSQLILPERFSNQPLANPSVDWGGPQAKGLRSLWPFTNGFRDVANRGQNQVVYNNPALQGSPGRRAALFNGTNQYINAYIPSVTPETISGEWTVTFWAKSSNWTTRQSFLGTRNPSEYGMDIKINGNGLGYINADIGNGTTFLTNPGWTVPAQSGEWGFYALVASTTGVNLYFNGVAYGLNTYSGSPLLTDANHQFYIGQMGQNAEWYGGGLSDLRIYSRALTTSEVQTIYAAPWQIFRKQRRLFFTGGSPATNSLTGTAEQQQAAAGQLSIVVPLHAVALQAQAGKASISVSVPLSGYATARPQADGSLSVSVPLSAVGVQQALARAALGVGVPLTGSSGQQVSTLGSLSVQIHLSGSELQQAAAVASLTNSGTVDLAGASGQSQAAAGSLAVTRHLQGATLAIQGASASLATGVPLSASSVSASRATGSLSVGIRLTGESLQQALASASLTNAPGLIDLSGSSAQQQSSTGTLQLQLHLTADSVQQVAAVATLGVSTPGSFPPSSRYYARAGLRAFYGTDARSYYARPALRSYYGSP